MTSISSCPQSRYFDSLPVEIVRRITTFLPCESVLLLSTVNRHLYYACYDRLVFQNAIKNCAGAPLALPAWDFHVLRNISSTSEWARYALADSLAARLAIKVDWAAETTRAFLVYGPQLVAAQHPIGALVGIYELTTFMDNTTGYSGWQYQAASFCAAARVLKGSLTDLDAVDHPASRLHPATPLTQQRRVRITVVEVQLRSTLGRPLRTEAESSFDNTLARRYDLAQRAVAVLAIHLQQQPSLGHSRWNPAVSRMLPNIPFMSLMKPPIPFSPDSPAAFSKCHLETMTSASFLEDGEWTGYYCYSFRDQLYTTVDPPMTGVQLTTSRSRGETAESVTVEGRGTDSIGAFGLYGTVHQPTGKVFMAKVYDNGTEWPWTALMTPFGIVGTWGSNPWGGWLWLWKSAWSAAIQ